MRCIRASSPSMRPNRASTTAAHRYKSAFSTEPAGCSARGASHRQRKSRSAACCAKPGSPRKLAASMRPSVGPNLSLPRLGTGTSAARDADGLWAPSPMDALEAYRYLHRTIRVVGPNIDIVHALDLEGSGVMAGQTGGVTWNSRHSKNLYGC